MQLARLTVVICLGVMIQKIGLLLLLDKEIFSANGVTPMSMAALYLPIPAINLLFIFFVIKRPAIHILCSYLALSILFYYHTSLDLAGIACLIAVGSWFGVAASGMLGQHGKIWFKTVASSILISSIAAEMMGAIIAGTGIKWLYLLSAISLFAALASLYYMAPVEEKIGDDNLILEIKVFPFGKTILIGIAFATAGFGEATLLSKLHSWGLGSEIYGWLLFGHSVCSIIALLLPPFKFSWVWWSAIWYVSVLWIVLGQFWFVVFGFAGLGAAGSVLMRDFKVDYLTRSRNPARMTAMVSLTLSTFMAFGALIGGIVD